MDSFDPDSEWDVEYKTDTVADSDDMPLRLSELFLCSRSVLEQLWGNLLYSLILCLTWRILYLFLVYCFRTPGKRNCIPVILLHAFSIILGILALYRFFAERVVLIVGWVGLLALIFAFDYPLLLISRTAGYNFHILVVIIFCSAVHFYCEFFMTPRHWHQIRGSVMILIMKAISFSSDLRVTCMSVEEIDRSPPLTFVGYRTLVWTSYALCPASIIFGPWIELARYERLIARPFDGIKSDVIKESPYSSLLQFLASMKHSGTSLVIALFSVVWSTCISYILASFAWDLKWWHAYVGSQSFRFSHYFVSYSSEALLAVLGVGYSAFEEDVAHKTLSSGPIHVTRMLEMEIPRSLVNVVTHWNLPMHLWLKHYVYKPVRPYGHMKAILMTYIVSSLLHGMNFQLSAVLLSIGLFAYTEFVLREKLATIFDSCIGSRRCRSDCTHKEKNGFGVYLCNFAFGCLAVFHLAYLAVTFDMSENQEQGYSMSHALQKWSELGFVSHYVALVTYVFCRYIS